MLACNERSPNTCVHHRVPAPHRLLPERVGPREPIALDHALVAAPHAVDEDVETSMVAVDGPEESLDLRIVRVIAAHASHGGRESRALDRSTGRVHDRAGVGECFRDATADATACAGDQCDRPLEIHGVAPGEKSYRKRDGHDGAPSRPCQRGGMR